jgi:hypothetical protein
VFGFKALKKCYTEAEEEVMAGRGQQCIFLVIAQVKKYDDHSYSKAS